MAKWKELGPGAWFERPSPSPEAIVRAALERAAVDVSNWGSLMCGHEDVTLEIISDIRTLASNPAEVAAIIKKAGETND